MVKVAAAQIWVKENPDVNLKEILACIKKAAGLKAKIVCFPEACLNSFERKVYDVTRHIKEIRRAAKENKIHVIFGTYIKKGKKITNEAFLIDKNGKIVYRYQKVNLWKSEPKYNVTAGKKAPKPIKLDIGTIGIVICWDYAFPEFLRKLSKAGAKIIFCPSYLVSFPKTRQVLEKMPLVRAFDTMAYTVVTDAFTGETFCQSAICHPLKELARIKNKPGIITADCDLKQIKALRKFFTHV